MTPRTAPTTIPRPTCITCSFAMMGTFIGSDVVSSPMASRPPRNMISGLVTDGNLPHLAECCCPDSQTGYLGSRRGRYPGPPDNPCACWTNGDRIAERLELDDISVLGLDGKLAVVLGPVASCPVCGAIVDFIDRGRECFSDGLPLERVHDRYFAPE